MTKNKLEIISILTLLLALSPALSFADSTPYRYRYGLGFNLKDSNESTPTNPDSPDPDGSLYTVASEWMDVSEPYDCTNYLPSEDTVPEGVWFYQKSDNCKSDQEREVTTYKRDDNGNSTAVGDPAIETRTVTIAGTQGTYGTKTDFSIYIEGPEVGSPYDVYLSWQSNNEATYQIKASAEGSGVSTSYTNFGAESYLDLSALDPKPGTYTFTVSGTNSNGEVTEAQKTVEIVDFSIKSFTMQETAVVGGQYVHLSWDAPQGATLTLNGYGDVSGLNSIVVQVPNRAGPNFWTLSAETVFKGETIRSRKEINYSIPAQ